MRNKYKAWLKYGALIATLTVVLWFAHGSNAQRSDTPSQPLAVPVTAAKAVRRDMPVTLTGLGNVQAYNTVTIRTQVDGQIAKIAFKEGQDVKPGDLLVQIDPRTYQAALDQAVARKAQDEAQLANARLDVSRYENLVGRNYISRQQLDTARAQVASLDAAVKGDAAAIENARVLLDYTTIRSPIEGKVGIRQIDVGNIVHPNDPNGIVVITQIHPISLIFTLPEDSVGRVQAALAKGQLPVTGLSRDGARELDQGRLELMDNQIDQSTGMVKLRATMPNQNNQLWPGEFVNAELRLGIQPQVVTIPATAVQRGQQGAYAYVVGPDRTADLRKLKLGVFAGGRVVVEDGVAEGETVVTTGQYRLQQGTHMDVKMVDEDAARPDGKPDRNP